MLPFLTMRFGTLMRNAILMSMPQLQVCKQQQTAPGNKICKLTYYALGSQTMRLRTLLHHIHLMAKPQSQVCKQQQTASSNKTCKLSISDLVHWDTTSLAFVSYMFITTKRHEITPGVSVDYVSLCSLATPNPLCIGGT